MCTGVRDSLALGAMISCGRPMAMWEGGGRGDFCLSLGQEVLVRSFSSLHAYRGVCVSPPFWHFLSVTHDLSPHGDCLTLALETCHAAD